MGKIRLNLVSGAVVEKPMVNAFVANNNKYVVLDNEMNGSMGLPIILVSKIESNKLTKIVDQNEWQLVKEYLKNIIAGGQIEFVAVDNEMAADDIYYTQLTLPIPSFDSLKNAYKVEINNPVSNSNEVGVLDLDINEEPKSLEPVIDPIGVVNPAVNDTPKSPFQDLEKTVEIPTQNTTNVVNNFEPEIAPTPIIEPNIPSSNNVNYEEEKAAFMKACENMFDALVQKFKG